MSPEKGSNLMAVSFIVGTVGVDRDSGVEASVMLDIEADSLESIVLVALWIARFAESM